MPHLQKVVSGGQTGVDRAGLDAAIAARIPIGGWCPRGRLAEDGPIPSRYPLLETPASEYSQRTEWNVRDSDGTLILYRDILFGGTAFTKRLADQYGRTCLCRKLDHESLLLEAASWVKRDGVLVLNIAGPRESSHPGIYREAFSLLTRLFAMLTV